MLPQKLESLPADHRRFTLEKGANQLGRLDSKHLISSSGVMSWPRKATENTRKESKQTAQNMRRVSRVLLIMVLMAARMRGKCMNDMNNKRMQRATREGMMRRAVYKKEKQKESEEDVLRSSVTSNFSSSALISSSDSEPLPDSTSA